jgi:uncharacterized protein (TIGR02217 family)
MAFYEQLFPPKISANMSGGPRFLVREANTIGGQRFTQRDDPYPIHEYQLAHPVRAGRDFEELRAFFWVIGGSADAFRFKDWSDYQATQQNTTLTLISGSTYQLCRTYAAPGRTFIRPIYKPVSGLKVYRTRSGSTSDITGSSTITTTNGRVVVTGHMSGDTYTWSGEFHVPVAFMNPQAAFQVVGGSSMLTEWPDIGLRETRDGANG